MQKKYISTQIMKKHRKKVIISAVVAVLSLCALTVGMLVAKYRNERSSEGTVRALNFYFTSNLLDGEEHTLAPGSDSVTFTLGNHADDLRYSEMEINYTVTVDNGAVLDKTSGTLKKGEVADDTIKITGLKSGNTYTITAIGNGGYSKTLKATIVVPEKKAELYYHIDNSAGEYTLLTIWNEGDVEGKVTIKYTGIPDNTNPHMSDWKTNENETTFVEKEVSIKAHESKVFRFFDETTIEMKDAEKKELY